MAACFVLPAIETGPGDRLLVQDQLPVARASQPIDVLAVDDFDFALPAQQFL
jgi:hypothetical protein